MLHGAGRSRYALLEFDILHCLQKLHRLRSRPGTLGQPALAWVPAAAGFTEELVPPVSSVYQSGYPRNRHRPELLVAGSHHVLKDRGVTEFHLIVSLTKPCAVNAKNYCVDGGHFFSEPALSQLNAQMTHYLFASC